MFYVEASGFSCFSFVVGVGVSSGGGREVLYNELRFGVRTLIFVANFFLLPRVCLALKDYRNLMPDTIGLIVFDNTEWTNFSSPTVHVVLMGIFIFYTLNITCIFIFHQL